MDSDIALTPPAPGLPASLLQEPGAFLWWYVDLLDAEGNGLVLIWSFGLPFLPGLRRALRRGEDARPSLWPALNVAVYRRGRPAFYALQRLDPRSACWRKGERHEEWRFGDTVIEARREPDPEPGRERVRVQAALDVTLPIGERVTGTVHVDGVARQPGASERSPVGLPRHEWSPITGRAHGGARLSLSGAPFVVEGRAYHDRNGGVVPLWELDIGRWLWGRVPFAGDDLVFFTLWRRGRQRAPDTLLLVVDEHGATRSARDVRVTLEGDRVSWSGMRLPRAITLAREGEDAPARVRLVRRHVVDEGPFYVRFLVDAERAKGDGAPERARGFVEGIVPARVDLPRHRPFVRMRVHDLVDGCSPWLPLFCGRKEGRLPRFGRSLWPFARGEAQRA